MTLSSAQGVPHSDIEKLVDRKILHSFMEKKRTYVSIINHEIIDKWIADYSEKASPDTPNRAAAVLENLDSKSGRKIDIHTLTFRSSCPGLVLYVDGKMFQPYELTTLGGALSLLMSHERPSKLSCAGKLYLIENLECWAHAEDYLPHDGLYLHYEGWLSEKMIEWLADLDIPEIILSPDYDLVGFQNWFRMKKKVKNAKLYFPSNFAQLIEAYPAAHLWKKQQGYLEKSATYLIENSDHETNLWFSSMRIKGAGLEQEALLIKKAT